MGRARKKAVLIVDDEKSMAEALASRFRSCNRNPDCPYAFTVRIALSTEESIREIRKKHKGNSHYDVVILDVVMESVSSGVEAALALDIEGNPHSPVRVIFTGHPSQRDCVQAMRYDAWDYIVKKDVGETPATQVVVNSVIHRLRQLDIRAEQERLITHDWLPRNFRRLRSDSREAGERLIALWHEPEVHEVADAQDAFELLERLGPWRASHEIWEEPYIVQIPADPLVDVNRRSGR